MDNSIWDCIVKRLSGEETEESIILLNTWLTENAAHEEEYLKVKSLWKLSEKLPPQEMNGFNLVKERILRGSEQIEIRPADNIFWKYGLAAAITGMFLFAAFFYYKTEKPVMVHEEWIVKKAGAGEMIRIVLPDSSKVWLNSGTELSFQSGFENRKLRLVKLNGEGYFEVTHDTEHPFVVNSGKLNTTVYGTSFNVRAYENEQDIAVSVNSGKVGVTTAEKEPAVFLQRRDKLVYDKQEGSMVRTVLNANDADSWLNGELIFEQTPLAEVFETLSRKFDLKITADAQKYRDCKLTAKFQNKSINEVLKTLKLALNIQSRSVGKTIFIEGGAGCSISK